MYPIVILSVTVIAFFGIMLFIVPKLGSILTSLGGPNAKLPIYTQVLLNISNFCVQRDHYPRASAHSDITKLPNLILLMILAVMAGIYLLRYIKTPKRQI